jgi:hypothetical protein
MKRKHSFALTCVGLYLLGGAGYQLLQEKWFPLFPPQVDALGPGPFNHAATR